MTDTIGSLLGAADEGPNDKHDANQYIIDSIPPGVFGQSRPHLDQAKATNIRDKIAIALGMTDEELSAKLADYYRKHKVAQK